MKRKKFAGALAGMAALLLAFVGTASATTLTSPVGTPYTSTFEAASPHITMHYPFIPGTYTCEASSMGGSVESHGALGPAVVKLSSLSFSCPWATVVKKPGVLEIDSNGAVTSTGAEVLVYVNNKFEPPNMECIYRTNRTNFGTLTSSSSSHAVIELGSAVIPRTGGNFACGMTAVWTGKYTITTPSTLVVD